MIFSLINQYCGYKRLFRYPTIFWPCLITILGINAISYPFSCKFILLCIFMLIFSSNQRRGYNQCSINERSKNTFPCVTNIEKRYVKMCYKKYMRRKKDDVTEKYHKIKT